ncbi:hypothetical protein EYC84_003120 [Monilinia fructicola]|uniref:Uncharacterized protein n=1 Tax=Monilinia fructicola TaxID=38448 RepID=A0A5M9JSN0_MONFR|nr:hypothetical protein EYC84_003120 [Monilinia fructicola]
MVLGIGGIRSEPDYGIIKDLFCMVIMVFLGRTHLAWERLDFVFKSFIRMGVNYYSPQISYGFHMPNLCIMMR